MKKQIRLFTGIALVVNAVTALILFFIFLGKKKGIAGAFAAVAAITGTAGGYLLYEDKVIETLKGNKCDCDGDCENCDCKDDCECDCNCDCKCVNDDDLEINENELFERNDETESK